MVAIPLTRVPTRSSTQKSLVEPVLFVKRMMEPKWNIATDLKLFLCEKLNVSSMRHRQSLQTSTAIRIIIPSEIKNQRAASTIDGCSGYNKFHIVQTVGGDSYGFADKE